MDRLKGKRALITGGTSGIGMETARMFLQEGARVAITGRDVAKLNSVRDELGGDVQAILSDASDVAAQKDVADAIRAMSQSLDILVINAGIADLRPVEQWDEASYDRTFALNVKGPYFLMQALLPLFSNPASIVLNTSVNAHIGMPTTSVYGASKAALLSMIHTLSGEWLPRGIRVNAVSAGPIATPLHFKEGMGAEQREAKIQTIHKLVPAGRFGNPSEVASAMLFLASSESEFTIGNEIIVGGGLATL